MNIMAYIDLLQYTLDGTLTGVLYAVIAIAFIVVYRAGRILNFAQGEVIIFMAYIIWTLIALAKLPIWAVIPLSLVVAMILGLVIERGIFRPLIGQPIWAIVMVTIGLMILIQGITQVICLANEVPVQLPVQMEARHALGCCHLSRFCSLLTGRTARLPVGC